MIKSKNSIVLIMLLSIILSNASLANKDEIIRIAAHNFKNDKVSYGTGFFWRQQDNILTAYHVVQGSDKIEIYYKGDVYDSISVKSYSIEHDLALLEILDDKFSQKSKMKFYKDNYNGNFQFTDRPPVMIIGYPIGWPQSHDIIATLSNTSLISSTTIRYGNEVNVFSDSNKIELLTLNVTSAYGGMSGAPVEINNNIVGVFSGSMHEYGTIAWAIPIKYSRDKMITANAFPHEIDWLPLTLMNKSNWRSLNFETTKPASDHYNIQFGFLLKKEFDYNAHLTFYSNDYTHNVSYGFEIGFFNYNYIKKYRTFSGLDETEITVNKISGFLNLFILRKHYEYSRRPYYGISSGIPFNSGLPLNIQIRAGLKLIPKFNFESRAIYFWPEQLNVVFNNYGDSKEVRNNVGTFNLYLGINYNH